MSFFVVVVVWWFLVESSRYFVIRFRWYLQHGMVCLNLHFLTVFWYGQDLEHLRETDPEFFKYLQQNDEELLKFGIEENSVQPANIPSAPEVSKSRESRGEEKVGFFLYSFLSLTFLLTGQKFFSAIFWEWSEYKLFFWGIIFSMGLVLLLDRKRFSLLIWYLRGLKLLQKGHWWQRSDFY